MIRNINDIVVPSDMAQSEPSEEKIRECEEYWQKYQEQDRYVVLNANNEIVDGYVQYLILKEFGVSSVIVKRLESPKRRYRRFTEEDIIRIYGDHDREYTYVYGVHPNSKDNREYVWKVPVKMENDFHANIGDMIFCYTKFGRSPVIVTKVEKTNERPVNLPIKRVAAKRIIKKEKIKTERW